MSQHKGSDKKDSFYDSGRADSGFLSGPITSENLSEEIAAEDLPQDARDPESKSQSDLDSQTMGKTRTDYTRFDSGVDLSDQMSGLDISITPTVEKLHPLSAYVEETSAWQLYFEQDEDGDTQLHIAIIHCLTEVVFNLIRMVPSPDYLNIRNDMRQTALHLAVLTSQPQILRRLIVAGADPGNVDRNGNTPLHLATYAGDLPCIRALTEKVEVQEIQRAQLRYTPTPARKIPSLADMVNFEGLTAVHLAALSGNYTMLKHLVKSGADIDAREGKAGQTVLHMAAELGNDALVLFLVRDLMADTEMPNYAGRTAYHVGRRYPKISRILVGHGAIADLHYFSSDDEDDYDIQPYGDGFTDLASQAGLINAA